jgi:hemolysin III
MTAHCTAKDRIAKRYGEAENADTQTRYIVMQDLTPGLTSGRLASLPREQSNGEELANSISHGAGLVAAIVATPFLILHAAQLGNARYLVGASIFSATMVLLYLASTLYHALPPGRTKHIFRIIEHSAIFLLIAGTSTPFTLGILYGTWGWTLLGLVWGLAVVGVILKVLHHLTHPIISTLLYLLMGWIILIAVNPFFTYVPLAGLIWLVAGGLAYTAGVAFFATDAHLHYGHFIWHLFVLTGTTCHYFAVLWYAA